MTGESDGDLPSDGHGPPLIKSVWLPCPVSRAFALITEQASHWWPASRRHTGDVASEIRLLATGRFWERAHDGREVELGRVRRWAPPDRLELDFYPGTDAEHPTRVVIDFAAEEGGSRVTITHTPTASSLPLWDKRVHRFDESWQRVLASLQEYAQLPA